MLSSSHDSSSDPPANTAANDREPDRITVDAPDFIPERRPHCKSHGQPDR